MQRIQPEQQSKWPTEPVLLGVGVRPWRFDRRMLFHSTPLDAQKEKTNLNNNNNNNNNNLTTVPHSSIMHKKSSIKTYSFWQHRRDICWCHHPLRGQAIQHLRRPPGRISPSLPTHRTPTSTNTHSYVLLSMLFRSQSIIIIYQTAMSG